MFRYVVYVSDWCLCHSGDTSPSFGKSRHGIYFQGDWSVLFTNCKFTKFLEIGDVKIALFFSPWNCFHLRICYINRKLDFHMHIMHIFRCVEKCRSFDLFQIREMFYFHILKAFTFIYRESILMFSVIIKYDLWCLKTI